MLLLATYKDFKEKLTDGKHSQKKIWEQIAAKVNENDYNVTGPQCAAKMRSLKKSYQSIKDHNNKKSGNDRRTWKFFEVAS